MHASYCGCDIQIQSVVEISKGSTVHVVSDEAPSTPVPQGEETPSIPETPHFDPDKGDPSPDHERTGIGARPLHQMDHGVRDPDCDCCKRALGPLYHHKIKGNRHLPVFTFDFSGPHPHRVNVTQYLLVCVLRLGHMRLVWAFGVESRQASVVLPCLQSSFEDLRALTGGSRPPILRMHSDKAREFLSPVIRTYLSQQGVRQTVLATTLGKGWPNVG